MDVPIATTFVVVIVIIIMEMTARVGSWKIIFLGFLFCSVLLCFVVEVQESFAFYVVFIIFFLSSIRNQCV
jgi:hypothetical protein